MCGQPCWISELCPTTLSSTLPLSEIPDSVKRKWFYQACAVTWVASGIWKGPLWGDYFKKLHCPHTQAHKCLQSVLVGCRDKGTKKGSVDLEGMLGGGITLCPRATENYVAFWKHIAVWAPGKLAQSMELRCRSYWVTKGRLGRCCVPQSVFLIVTVNHRSIARRATLLFFLLSLSSCCHPPPP